jgi:Flp pilus assembly protein TadD
MAYYMMGNEAPARLALERAVASDKEYVGKEEAAQKLASLTAELPTAPSDRIAPLEKALVQSPNDTILLTRLGAAYEASGQLEKTRETAERILKANPKAVEAMLMLVRVYGARPDGAQRALDYAKAARAAAPGDDAVAHAAGRAAFEAGQHEWAYSILQESGRDNRDDPELLYDLAWSAYAVGRVAEAETAMRSALGAGTNFSRLDPARRFLEILPFTRSPATTAEATAKLEAALKADPNYLPGLMAAAVAWEQRGNYVEAQKRYEQILGRYRLFLPATRNLALLDINHLGEAQKGYELGVKARQGMPEDTELAQALGKLSYTRGEYQYAVQLLREVQQKKAASAETYYFLGMSQYRLKQTTDSATSLRQALAMNLEAKLGDEARKVLAQVTKP